MTFEEYQEEAATTLNSELPMKDKHVMLGLGLCGEAGECADIIKKTYFHYHELDREHLLEEMGDVLWYLSNMADNFGFSLEEVARFNNKKLKERYGDKFAGEKSINRSK